MNLWRIFSEQYQNDDNLLIRIKLHSKHSTNKQGWYPWLFEHYEFNNGYRILELGCGNGNQWQGRVDELPPDCTLVLSDFSEGMVNMVWEKYSCHKNILTQKIDIQNIPVPDNYYDVVIANHMLYHVPDLSKAISEVHRFIAHHRNSGFDWMKSTIAISNYSESDFDKLYDYFENIRI